MKEIIICIIIGLTLGFFIFILPNCQNKDIQIAQIAHSDKVMAESMETIKETLHVHSVAIQKAMSITESSNSRWADIMLLAILCVFGLTALVIAGFIIRSIPENDGKTIIIMHGDKEIEYLQKLIPEKTI